MSESPHYVEDTIAALATPPGIGGIGIIRVSGPEAERIAGSVIGEVPPPRRAVTATFSDANGDPVDTGLALWFPAPESFTGESVLELHGHGGPAVLSLVLDAVLEKGARRAEPGEFSKRAFLNGKLDLVQAEAIADVIESGTAQAARAAHRTLTGAFSDAVDALAVELTELRLYVEAAIDFPEEEIDFLSDAALKARIERCADVFEKLSHRTRAGRLLRDGLQIVIVGRPNAGKSSLLNRLSGEETAIVTEVAGTTRDILREQININGVRVELIDTAGLRDDPDAIEAEGIRRARRALADADAVLWIQDASSREEDLSREDIPDDIPCIVLRNKIDLTDGPAGVVSDSPPVLNASAKTGAGIDALRELIRTVAGVGDTGEGAFTARQRHIDALEEASKRFAAGRAALEDDRAGEILAEELRLAQLSLGSITGTVTSDDLLGQIFAEFCIGK